ncbi:MAG: hypothetical protein QXJ74_00075 [Nitrososphaera sp.]|uniref:hypothetical protein n=1 Tax=Nitrososphaera sp. TaxID=1971748 RepID=UPI0017FD62D4|nr:hypothetical protein [Nitrososphaera sp.]NWG36427.1 hypothetical protein [Nitrososphaera sp.]
MTYMLDRRVMDALARSLDVLGESSKKVVLYHISQRGVNPEGATLEEVEAALYAMLGPAASIITGPMLKELEP